MNWPTFEQWCNPTPTCGECMKPLVLIANRWVCPDEECCTSYSLAEIEAIQTARAEAQAEYDLNPDNGPSDANYQRDMRETGRSL
jgi:hypothetical protein